MDVGRAKEFYEQTRLQTPSFDALLSKCRECGMRRRLGKQKGPDDMDIYTMGEAPEESTDLNEWDEDVNSMHKGKGEGKGK